MALLRRPQHHCSLSQKKTVQGLCTNSSSMLAGALPNRQDIKDSTAAALGGPPAQLNTCIQAAWLQDPSKLLLPWLCTCEMAW
jgi:hypothetical protein